MANEFGVSQNLDPLLKDGSIFVMGLYHCTHMCNFIIKTLDQKLSKFKKYPTVIYFGIDENEGPRDALLLKKRIIGPQKKYWSFLTSDKESISKISHSLNFKMKRNPVSENIDHEMGVYSVQNGSLTKIDEFNFIEDDLKKTTIWHSFVKFCSEYDPKKSKYGPLILKSLSISSIFFLITASLGLLRMKGKTA
ncbi:MAG: hypothetical protein AB7I27_13505 [Bacteriovoracaceae bacterium]